MRSEIEEYIKAEELYRKFRLADLGEFCLHHVESMCEWLKKYGETWMPANCAKEFAEYASYRLKQNVIMTGKEADESYYKAGKVCQLII